jgi:hypothetical protein
MEELTDREIDSILNALLITSSHYMKKADTAKENGDDEYVSDFHRLADDYYALYRRVERLVID